MKQTITLLQNQSLQFRQLKTQSKSAITNFGKEPLEVELTIFSIDCLIACESGAGYFQAWASIIELWENSELKEVIWEAETNDLL